MLSVMDDRGDDGRVGCASGEGLVQMYWFTRATRRDYGNRDRIADEARYFEIVAGLGAVAIYRVDAQFAGTEALALARPVQRVAAGGSAAAVDDDLASGGKSLARLAPFDLHREHDTLAAEGTRALRNDLWIARGPRIDRDLSGPRQ